MTCPGDQPDEHRPEEVELQIEHRDRDRRPDQHEAARAEDAGAQRPQQAPHGRLLAGAHEERAEIDEANPDRHHQQRQHQRLRVEQQRVGAAVEDAERPAVEDGVLAFAGRADDRDGGERHRRDDRAGVGLEQVGAHARHVADVVADVVRDGGGLRGSSSGMPTSALPTRSAPTSAALVKMPPPTRAKSAIEEAPNANAVSGSTDSRDVEQGDRGQAQANHGHPMTVPEEKATRSAGLSPTRAFAAVRRWRAPRRTCRCTRRAGGESRPAGRRGCCAGGPSRAPTRRAPGPRTCR